MNTIDAASLPDLAQLRDAAARAKRPVDECQNALVAHVQANPADKAALEKLAKQLDAASVLLKDATRALEEAEQQHREWQEEAQSAWAKLDGFVRVPPRRNRRRKATSADIFPWLVPARDGGFDVVVAFHDVATRKTSVLGGSNKILTHTVAKGVYSPEDVLAAVEKWRFDRGVYRSSFTIHDVAV